MQLATDTVFAACPHVPPPSHTHRLLQHLKAVRNAKTAEVEVSKLNYRILHLTRSLKAADQQAAARS